MKNTFGQCLSVTLFGESHGEAVGAVIDGIGPGIAVDKNEIERQLSRRRPSSALDTVRVENDEFSILSGVFEGRTTGTPVCIVIKNGNTKSGDYTYGVARPSHADYAASVKYHGCEDYRGGGHFSGRITAALVAVGGILLPALEKKGILIGTHISQCGKEKDRDFDNILNDIVTLKNASFPVLGEDAQERIANEIMAAKNSLDSVGGATQTAIYGLPAGVGEPWFDSVESVLSHALFGIGAVKGVEFGLGFGFASANGSRVNDPIRTEKGRVWTETNNNGGINGGITNGMPVVFRCAVKPTPSIAKEQKTVDFIKNENTTITVGGRHDPAIVRRICPVIDSVAAIAVCDLLAQRYGTDYLAGEEPVCSSV